MHGNPGQVLSVLLVEGDTEKIFYERVKETFIRCPCKVDNIYGLFNVNDKILHNLTTENTDRLVRAYCCLDRESRHGKTPAFDLVHIRKELKKENVSNILTVDKIIATQMVESWFFHDIMGIYKFLKVPKAERNPKAFQPVERFRKSDLHKLFQRYEKVYIEGERARHFIESLDINLIYDKCKTLKDGIQLINKQG